MYCARYEKQYKNSTDDLEAHRKFAEKAAKELCYDKSVISDISKASTHGEINRILQKARVNKWNM